MVYTVDIVGDASSIVSPRPDNMLIREEILLGHKKFWPSVTGQNDGLFDGSF